VPLSFFCDKGIDRTERHLFGALPTIVTARYRHYATGLGRQRSGDFLQSLVVCRKIAWGKPVMNRRVRALIAVGTVSALCLGSFEAASAITSKTSVSATSAIKACATSGGSLRLTKASGKCPSGTSRVGLARPAIAPKAIALDITSGTETKSLSLLANTKLVAHCTVSSLGNTLASLDIVRAGKTQIDGTSFLVEHNGIAVFRHQNGDSNQTPDGADSVYSTGAGGFVAIADMGEYSEYTTLNAHLLVTVPGAVFTIDEILDANSTGTGPPYCRISAEVESATT
jgi:hypothetical protein